MSRWSNNCYISRPSTHLYSHAGKLETSVLVIQVAYTMLSLSNYYSFLFVLLSLKPLALSTVDDVELRDDPKNPCYIYKALATELLEDDRNFYNLQSVFFSPNSGSPVFVTVTYHYEDNNATMSCSSTSIFFWSSAIYFFFHPVRIFQFTSLLFSDPALRFDKVDLYLSSNYSSVDSECMILLTQRVNHHIIVLCLFYKLCAS